MQVSDLVQEGCTLQARFVVQGQQNTYDKFTSQILTINTVAFQVQVNQIYAQGGVSHQILMGFSIKPEDDHNNILKISSKALNVTNKCLRNYDGSWYSIHTLLAPTCCSKFDVTFVVEADNTTSRCFASLYDDDVLADFEFRCEKGSVKVHKTVLAISSPVLRRELEGDWRETKQGYVDIPNTTLTTLKQFKDFMYLHVIPDTGAEQLLLLASYYMMPELEQKCVEKVIATVNVQNALSLLEFAVAHRMTNLHLALLGCIESGTIKVSDLEKEVRAKKLSEN